MIDNNSKAIRITRRTDDWHACIDGSPEIWGCGKTMYAAIGNLITAHTTEFGITIIYPSVNSSKEGK